MRRRTLTIGLLAVVFGATLIAGCGKTQFPATPTPVANSPLTTVGGGSYSGSIVLSSGSSTSLNMTLIARGLGSTTQSHIEAQASGVVEVTGNYETGTGLKGTVQGTLQGTMENGTFQGKLISDAPACSRGYSGVITDSGIAWNPTGDSAPGCPLTFAIQIRRGVAAECTYSASLDRQSFSGNGGSGVATVNSPSGCTWLAESLAPWIVIGNSDPKTGAGTVPFSVVANSQGARQGQLKIANQTFTISQGTATACSTSVSPLNLAISGSGGSGQVTVASGQGCDWTAQSGAPWIIVAPASGGGNATVTITAQANGGAAREGTVTIAGQTVTISQAAGSQAPDCSVSVSPLSVSMPSAGGSAPVSVTIAAGCEWTAQSNADWIAVTPSSGNGSSTVTITAQPTNGAARQGSVTIAGQTVTISEAAGSQAPGCSVVSVSSLSVSVPSAGGSAPVSVTIAAGCEWTAQSNADWIAVTPSSGNGNSTVTITAQANNGAARQGTVSVAGQTVTVTQQPRPAPDCSSPVSVSPTSVALSAAGANASVSVTTVAGCGWTAQSNAGWITVTPSSGNGNSTVTITAQRNNSAARQGTINIGGQSVTVSQESGCSYSLSPNSATVPADGGTVSATITSECEWTTQSNAGWITVSPPKGTGNGTVTFTVQSNAGAQRVGTTTIGGQTFTVTQQGLVCNYGITPTSASYTSDGGVGSVTISAASAACGWTVVSDASWITIATPANGSGSSGFRYVVQANSTSAARSGTVRLVAGGTTLTLTVNQAGAPSASITIHIIGRGAVNLIDSQTPSQTVRCVSPVCVETVAAGRKTLQALPELRSIFINWDGCTPLGPKEPNACSLTAVAGAKHDVYAVFRP